MKNIIKSDGSKLSPLKSYHMENKKVDTRDILPKGFIISGDQLKQICPRLTVNKAAELAMLMNEFNPAFGITKPTQLHEFIGQCAHESNQFTVKTENMNYSATRLMQVWPKRFPTIEKAKQYANDSQKLANHVYANRMGNGNEASGDGFRNRGGGFIQATGADMYKGFHSYLTKMGYAISLDELRKQVRENDRYAMLISYWIFYIKKGMKDEAERDDDLAITRAINGGTIGYDERVALTRKAREVVK